jgi:putative ABC transport system substrate-binding protein
MTASDTLHHAKHYPLHSGGHPHMKRSALVLVPALAVLFSSAGSAILAQAADKVWRLGVLSLVVDPIGGMSTTVSELAARGFVEGQNLVVDVRVGTAERMPALARELVGTGPDVILAVSDWAVTPAHEATRSIPIVASPMGADPVAVGVAKSWARPGGNVTGVTLTAPELEIKRLDLLREVVPAARRVAVLLMHREVTEPGEAPMRAVAARLGIRLVELYVGGPDGYHQAFVAMRSAGAEALVITPMPEFGEHAEELAALAVEAGLPTICGSGKAGEQGCLIGYGPDMIELRRQAADDVARIFRGASPSELPIEGPTHFDFVVNLKTAKALGLTVPPSILARAEVIE